MRELLVTLTATAAILLASSRWLGKPMPKPPAEQRISPRNQKISRLFNE
jgi:hypothetical protein